MAPTPTTCAKYQCPQGMQLRPNAPSIKCPKVVFCDSSDKDLCCEAPATCATPPFTCPAGWLPKPNPASIQCADPKACSVPTDTAKCCDRKTTTTPSATTTHAHCGAFICP